MLEAALVIAHGGHVLYRHTPKGRTSVSLPDSDDLWGFIWKNRETVLGIAHSHPGAGQPSPSYEDVTTFDAVEAALGHPLMWWISSSDQTILVERYGADDRIVRPLANEPHWVSMLRELSKGD